MSKFWDLIKTQEILQQDDSGDDEGTELFYEESIFECFVRRKIYLEQQQKTKME
jgi:hypothetical protein